LRSDLSSERPIILIEPPGASNATVNLSVAGERANVSTGKRADLWSMLEFNARYDLIPRASRGIPTDRT